MVALIGIAVGSTSAVQLAEGRPPAAEGHLDKSFGSHGWTTVHLNEGAAIADVEPEIARDGSPIVADLSSGTFFGLTPTGTIDRGFGRKGRAHVGELAGSEGVDGRFFHASAAALDQRGRLLVFGYQIDNRHPLEGPNAAFQVEQNAMVFRLGTDGLPDRSFGNGRGFVRSSFDLSSRLGDNVPLVGAMAGAVDSRGRPVLVAGVEEPYSACYGHSGSLVQPRAVVRLTQAGAPDPTFGEGGVSAVEGSSSYPVIAPAADGAVQVGVGNSGQMVGCRAETTLVRLDADGQREATFGTDGVRTVRGLAFAALQPSGATLLLGDRGGTLRLARLRPDGVRDDRFGDGGTASVRVPAGSAGTVGTAGVDARGRIILIGLVDPRSKNGGSRRRDSIVVGRLLSDGSPDPSFGKDGWISTPFPKSLSIATVDGALDRQGRLVVVGATTGHPHGEEGGFIVARYLLE